MSAPGMGVVVVGHGAPWLERESLIAYSESSCLEFLLSLSFAQPMPLSAVRISIARQTTRHFGREPSSQRLQERKLFSDSFIRRASGAPQLQSLEARFRKKDMYPLQELQERSAFLLRSMRLGFE